jgi:hypothetical protein
MNTSCTASAITEWILDIQTSVINPFKPQLGSILSSPHHRENTTLDHYKDQLMDTD